MVLGHVRSRTIRGKIIKEVTCGFCGTEFVYRMKRTAGATTWSPGILPDQSDVAAAQRARARVNASLSKSTDPIPCPACGMIQPDMIRNAIRKRILIMTPLFLSGMVIFYYVADLNRSSLSVTGTLVIGAVFIAAVVFTLLQNFNAHPDRHKNDPRAVPRPEYERMAAEEAARKDAARARNDSGN